MCVEVRLFATLRSYLPAGSGPARAQLELPAGTTIAGLIEHLGIPPAMVHLVMIDGRHEADLEMVPPEGSAVSIFPAVAGG